MPEPSYALSDLSESTAPRRISISHRAGQRGGSAAQLWGGAALGRLCPDVSGMGEGGVGVGLVSPLPLPLGVLQRGCRS